MSGYTDSGEGHGSSETSRRRAQIRDESGLSITQKQWIAAHIDSHGGRGVTQEEAKPEYRRMGIQDSTYTGSRNAAHRAGLVVTLREERGGQTVYVGKDRVFGRPIEPYHPNAGRRIIETPPQVSVARGIIAAWAEQNKPGGMLVTAPDWDALQILLDYAD